MALPVDFNTGTVTGHFVDLLGNPVTGKIVFSVSTKRLIDPAFKTIIVPAPKTAILDPTGSITIDLPATDDPDVLPMGFTYQVAEQFGVPGQGLTYSIAVPKGTTIDLSTVVGVSPSNGATITMGPPGTSFLSGFGPPGPLLGNIGDTYLDKTAGRIYGPKDGTGWGSGTLLPGGGGVGTQFLSGSGAPGALLGNIGDTYWDSTGGYIYGPKTSLGWGAGVPIGGPGTSGTSMLAGQGPPAPSLGNTGDVYFDTLNSLIYGPKSPNNTPDDWGVGVAIGTGGSVTLNQALVGAMFAGNTEIGVTGTLDGTGTKIDLVLDTITAAMVDQTEIPVFNAGGGIVTLDDGDPTTAATHLYVDEGDYTLWAALHAEYNAFSVMAADVDNTPLPVTLGASTVLGRGPSGGIVAVPWSSIGSGGGGGGDLVADGFGNWELGTGAIHRVDGTRPGTGTPFSTNLIYPGAIRECAGVSVETAYTITGLADLDNDPAVGTAYLARIDQILDSQDAFLGPVGFTHAFPFPNKFKGQPSNVGFGGPPAAVFECEGVTQYNRSASGFASLIAFQNTKLIKNVHGVDADIAGHQGFLNIPAYMADGAHIAMARCGPGATGGPMSQPIGGEFARDGVVALHQGFCDYPAFVTDMVSSTASQSLSDIVLVSFSSIATFGQGASGAMRHGFRYEDAQTNLHPCLTNETARVTVTASSGNISISYHGQTATIPFNSSHAQVQTALENLSNIGAGNVSVTSAGLALSHYIEFVGALKDTYLGPVGGEDASPYIGPITATGATVTHLGRGGNWDFYDANILQFTTLGTLTKQIAVNIPFLEGAVINIGLHNGSTTVNAPTPTQLVTAGSLIKANSSHARINSAAAVTFNGTASTFGGGFEDGQEMKVSNMGVNPITFVDASTTSSAVSLPGKQPLTLEPLESMTISWWDAFNLWYVVATSNGSTSSTTFDTGQVPTGGRMKVADYGVLAVNTLQLETYAGVDTYPRVSIGTDNAFGVVNFSSGAAAHDVSIFRSGANAISIAATSPAVASLTVPSIFSGTIPSTGGAFRLSDLGFNSPTVGFKAVAADAQDKAYFGLVGGAPQLSFGLGGSTGVDTIMVRQAAGVFGAPAWSASGLPTATTATRYVGGIASGVTPTTATGYATGDWVVDTAGRMWVNTFSGLTTAWIQVGTQLKDGTNLTFGTTTGTQIATGATQRLGFWGKAPIVRPNAPPADATDLATAITLVNSLKSTIRNLGLTA